MQNRFRSPCKLNRGDAQFSDETANLGGLFCSLRVGKSRDKVIALPKLAVLAVYKLPRFLDCFSLVGTFDALDARKVSIIAKGVGAILMHELRSASCNAQAGARTRKAALTRLPRDGDHKRLRALETQLRALFSIQSSASWRVSNQLMY